MSMIWKYLSNLFWILLLSTVIMCCFIQGHRHHHGIRARCQKCPPGYGVLSEVLSLEEKNNASCMLCPNDTYSSYTLYYCSSCLPCSRCGEGLYIAHPCLPNRDTICDSCHTYQGPHNDNYVRRCIYASLNNSAYDLSSASQASNASEDSLIITRHYYHTFNNSNPFAGDLSNTPNLKPNSTISVLNVFVYNVSQAFSNDNSSYDHLNSVAQNRTTSKNGSEFYDGISYSSKGKGQQIHNGSLTAAASDTKMIGDESYGDNNTFSKDGDYQESFEPGIVQCSGNDCIRSTRMEPMVLFKQLTISLSIAIFCMLLIMLVYAVFYSKNAYGYKVVATIEDI